MRVSREKSTDRLLPGPSARRSFATETFFSKTAGCRHVPGELLWTRPFGHRVEILASNNVRGVYEDRQRIDLLCYPFANPARVKKN